MAIRSGTVSCSRYRVQGSVPKDVKKWLTRALAAHAFRGIDLKGDEERAAGFVALENASLFEGTFGVFSWRIEKIRLPAAELKSALQDWLQKFENKNGRAAGRREKAEQKELIRKSFRAKTPPISVITDVSLELPKGELLVWTGSNAIAEEVQATLEQALEVRFVPRVPSSFVSATQLERLGPTAALFGGI